VIQHAEYEEHGGIAPHSDAGIAMLDSVQSHAVDGCPFRHKPRLNATAAAGITDIIAELGQGAPDRYGEWWSVVIPHCLNNL
jgi:hypothetical protein